jgi:outer membrane receptor protein involved in Fe transport
VAAARTGAVTDTDGRYVVLNVPAGTYDVRINLIGYKTTTVQGLTVSADQTTSLDVRLEASPLELEEVVIIAERPVVDVNTTSNVASVTRREIESLPVQELSEIVNLQAGVIEGHFRGGRLGEVQYQVDGVTVNNPYDNRSGITLDRSLLEEVQVVSGTFDAEYGQAMSGVVNAVLKRGTERFELDAEAYTGDAVFGGGRVIEDDWNLGSQANYTLNLSGPAGLPKTTFLLGGRRTVDDGWVLAERRFLPTDDSDLESLVFRPSGDGDRVPLDYRREWGGIAKVSNRSLEDTELSYQAIVVDAEQRNYDYGFRLNPDGLPTQHTVSLVHGFDMTHTLSDKSFLNLAVRQNIVDYTDFVYENVNDPRYDEAGPPVGNSNYENGAVVQGVSFNRFEMFANSMVYKGSFVRQISSDHQFKLGAESQWSTLRFGAPGYLVAVQGDTSVILQRRDNEPPRFPGVQEYQPVSAAAYAQEEIEWNDLNLRAGVRFDFFDARSSLPSDLANPANAIAGAPYSAPKATSAKISFSPRLGVSYPVAKDAALFFAYGHFYQLPPLGDIFRNANYDILEDLQAGTSDYGVIGNPDVEPERTVQYQFGYKQAVTDWLGLDITTFFKDVRDLLGVEFISTYNDAEYARLTNVDFGNVLGFTVALNQRQRGLLSSRIDYTWQQANGNASDPRETATRASAGEDPRPREVPFSWDQRHTLNISAWLSRPDDFTISGILRLASGQPYTPNIESGFGGGLETNSGRKPPAVQLDLRAEKSLSWAGYRPLVFLRLINAFDARYFNGFVFESTGSPYYSRDAAVDQGTLANPGRFYGPRRIELGVRMHLGGERRQEAS